MKSRNKNAETVHAQQKKITFRLEKDEDGYPPNEWETLWATEVETGLFLTDNIPFFVQGISCGDVISVRDTDGKLYFDRVVRESRNSVLRVIVYDRAFVEKVRSDLKEMNCESEQSHIANLISVNVPEQVDLDIVIKFLDKGEKKGILEYETASLRQ